MDYFDLYFAGPIVEHNGDLTISQIGLSMWLCMWQYDDRSMRFRVWSLIGQNKFTLQTSADASQPALLSRFT